MQQPNHVSSVLKTLEWLPISLRVKASVLVTYKVPSSLAHDYLFDLILYFLLAISMPAALASLLFLQCTNYRPPQKVSPLGLPLSTLGYFLQGPSTQAHPTFPSSHHHMTSCQDFLDNPFQNCKLPTLLQNPLLFTFFYSTLSSSVLYNLLICGVQNLSPVFSH